LCDELPDPTTQLTLRIPEFYDSKLRLLGAELPNQTNRQGAINHILNLYFSKELSQSSAHEMR
jgi:hypothetical protein